MNTNNTLEQLPARLIGRRGDRPSTTVLPTGIEPVDQLGEQLTALRNELDDLNDRYRELNDKKALIAAKSADDDAYARAKLDDKKDPGAVHANKRHAELSEMARIGRGLHEAIRRVDAEYRAAVLAHREQLAAETLATLDETRATVEAKVAELVALVDDVERLHRFSRWLDGGPSTASRPKPIGATVADRRITVAELLDSVREALTKRSALEPAPAGYLDEHRTKRDRSGESLAPDPTKKRRRSLGKSLNGDGPSAA